MLDKCFYALIIVCTREKSNKLKNQQPISTTNITSVNIINVLVIAGPNNNNDYSIKINEMASNDNDDGNALDKDNKSFQINSRWESPLGSTSSCSSSSPTGILI